MRLLFVCGEYPPIDTGGFSQLCHDLAHALRQRNHQVFILCNDTNARICDLEPVSRELCAPIDFACPWPIPVQQIALARMRHRRNLAALRRVLERTRAQAVVFWPNLGFDHRLMVYSEQISGLLVTYYTAGVSPNESSVLRQYWAGPSRTPLSRITKPLLRPFFAKARAEASSLAMRHVMCVSEYECQQVINKGVRASNTVVVNNGIDLNAFHFLGRPSARRQARDPLNVLYLGRLVETKGVHTVLEAIASLHSTNPDRLFHLTLLGQGPNHYVLELDKRVHHLSIEDCVSRRVWVPREQVPTVMAGNHVLVLPTVSPEPLARVVQEAMAMGLVVVATPTGGTPEIVQDGSTGLTFPPEDPIGLAACLSRLYSDLGLCDRLAIAAYDLIRSRFTIQLMAESVESHFQQWIKTDTGSADSAN